VVCGVFCQTELGTPNCEKIKHEKEQAVFINFCIEKYRKVEISVDIYPITSIGLRSNENSGQMWVMSQVTAHNRGQMWATSQVTVTAHNRGQLWAMSQVTVHNRGHMWAISKVTVTVHNKGQMWATSQVTVTVHNRGQLWDWGLRSGDRIEQKTEFLIFSLIFDGYKLLFFDNIVSSFNGLHLDERYSCFFYELY
jgi:hypothetical protein